MRSVGTFAWWWLSRHYGQGASVESESLLIADAGSFMRTRCHWGLGLRIGRKRVARLMLCAGLSGVYRRRARGCTVRDPSADPHPDLVRRAFAADGPDRLWCMDITQPLQLAELVLPGDRHELEHTYPLISILGASSPQYTASVTYRTRLVFSANDTRWVKDTDLPIPPFPGLGVRVDTYEVLNITAVTVGEPGCDAECEVEEEEPTRGLTESDLQSFGFRKEPLPVAAAEAVGLQSVRTALILVDSELGTWEQTLMLPFPPFAGLRVRLAFGALLNVFTVVVGDRRASVTCIATIEDSHRPLSAEDLEALGFEESVYP